ncbi:hypothetical protein AcV7_005502 [Taiwanofungus camphoratus]|nr:hypothetical protein AcV7_005502 [Antrodia cinnamomea]
MPPRISPKHSQVSFYPSNDPATYRDLLLFQERLKTNAALLNRRKHRYQLFLAQLLLTIIFLLSEAFLQTNFLSIPYKIVLQKALPDVYQDDTLVQVPPYFASGLLFVAVTTLVLFFASGMYSEKVGYANRYVPHANRSLRSFNMYLNVRQPPLRSKLPFSPFSFFFPRPHDRRAPPSVPPPRRARSPSPPAGSARRSSSVPIPSIPPASDPRGELIFSSRVDRAFRESYERYRAAFERRREERERAAYARTWIGAIHLKTPWVKKLSTAPAGASSAGLGIPKSSLGQGAYRVRETGSPSQTPSSSRHSSPVPPRAPPKAPQGGVVDSGGGAPSPPQHHLVSEVHSEVLR